jgi:hypothetical protein
MINLGASSLIHWKDDWTATTRDGKRSAQFEETILCVLSCRSPVSWPSSLTLPHTYQHHCRRR